MFLVVDTIQLISIVLVLILLFLGFKVFETKWSYKISKPHSWESALKRGSISKRLIEIESAYRDKVRFYNLWFQVMRLKKNGVPGAFAELGVYKGETAEMLHCMDDSRELLLFDTFEGFNKNDLQNESAGDAKYNENNFKDTALKDVQLLFPGKETVFYYPGYFPDTTKDVGDNSTFALVHLDADLYNPTLAGLNYFYSRLSPGGIIIIHDYNHTWNGVTKAVDEFLQAIPESLIEIPDWQGSAMIIKNR